MNYLVGAQGTGKTTLLQELLKVNQSIYITDGFSRPVKNLKRELNFSDLDEQKIINELTKWNWVSNINNPIYYSTRSIIDAIVYTKVLTPSIDVSNLMQAFQLYNSKSLSYFYIPIEFELTDDKVRFLDPVLQQTIDKELVNFLKDNNVSYITLKGTVEERLNTLLSLKKF